MKQKIILKDNILFKDNNEIEISVMQNIILKYLADEMVHSYISIIKKAKMKRGVFEKYRLQDYIRTLKNKTGLDINELKGVGYYLNQKIYIIN